MADETVHTEEPMEPPRAPRFYVNQANVTASPFDVVLDLGFRVGPEDPEAQVRVMMSVEYTASLVALLNGVLEAYERQVGSIPDVAKEVESTDERCAPEVSEQS